MDRESKRIAFINTYGNGSTGRIVDSLKRVCAEEGYEVKSFYAREFCNTPETSVKVFSKIGFYIDALMTRIFDNHGLNNRMNTRRLIKELKNYQPDIIHIHNLHGYWLNYKLLFKYLNNINAHVVFTLHDTWSFTGHCAYYLHAKCLKWQNKCERCPQRHEYPKAVIFDGSKRNYRLKKKYFTLLPEDRMDIVCPSEWLAGEVRKSYLSKYPVYVINNGIDTDVFKPTSSEIRERYNFTDKNIILGVASNWTLWKGLNFIKELALKESDWQFVVIGALECEETDLTSIPNILHLPRTESVSELAQWYTVADIFINPTLEDNYPTTNLEAIACGTPVVTFPTGGSVEIVQKTGFGVVCDECNTNSLRDGIIKALEIQKTEANIDANLLDADNKFGEYLNLFQKNL